MPARALARELFPAPGGPILIHLGMQREKNMPCKVLNTDLKADNGDIVQWAESGWEVLEMMVLMDEDIELYPIEFKRLEVYDGDF